MAFFQENASLCREFQIIKLVFNRFKQKIIYLFNKLYLVKMYYSVFHAKANFRYKKSYIGGSYEPVFILTMTSDSEI